MPKSSASKEIKASAERIYQILKDREKNPVWNITVNEVEIVDDKVAKYKTTVGDLTTTLTEDKKNEKIFYSVEGNPLMKTMEYSINPEGDVCEVTLAAEFPEPDQEQILLTAGDVLLTSLKKFAEYLEEGGDPSSYKKK
ncbi:MAG: hypothetical protein BAJALOKI1v1_720010 [Promethearchaeota archaeon]|nr:MAG: hypothetical protein BAJALOKI1v1_720010 [Candidatus Lokiarchaeota archaeon]